MFPFSSLHSCPLMTFLSTFTTMSVYSPLSDVLIHTEDSNNKKIKDRNSLDIFASILNFKSQTSPYQTSRDMLPLALSEYDWASGVTESWTRPLWCRPALVSVITSDVQSWDQETIIRAPVTLRPMLISHIISSSQTSIYSVQYNPFTPTSCF